MANYTTLETEFNTQVKISLNGAPPDNAKLQKIFPRVLFGMRQKYINELAQHTLRNVICYYSTWLHSRNLVNPNPELMINDNDINGFMNAVSMRDKTKGLDLILHTPGGITTATESIVKYLRKMFKNDIRVIVPHMAMSAGTMIACASKEIIMGKQSSLGPIDPQYKNVPAEGVLAEFKRAIEESVEVPNKSLIWKEIIGKYRPTFVGECDNVVRLSRTLVSGWLSTCMFKYRSNRDIIIEKILEELASHEASMVHDKHYDYEDCRKLGLKVFALEKDQILQDRVLSVHHSYVLSAYKHTNSIKYIESDKGMTFIISG